MITFRCPKCGEPISIGVDGLDTDLPCPSCGVTCRCPPDAYHRSRLRSLRAVQLERRLTAAELREAAVHYRALGKDDKARAAELAARANEPIDPERFDPLVAANADLVAAQQRQVRVDLYLLCTAVALWSVTLVGTSVGAVRWTPWLHFHGLACLLVAAVCRYRRRPAGLHLLAGLVLSPVASFAWSMWISRDIEGVDDDASEQVVVGLGWAAVIAWLGVVAYLVLPEALLRTLP